jgi:hypothetical protein
VLAELVELYKKASKRTAVFCCHKSNEYSIFDQAKWTLLLNKEFTL